jgi:hypothetical protein
MAEGDHAGDGDRKAQGAMLMYIRGLRKHSVRRHRARRRGLASNSGLCALVVSEGTYCTHGSHSIKHLELPVSQPAKPGPQRPNGPHV